MNKLYCSKCRKNSAQYFLEVVKGEEHFYIQCVYCNKRTYPYKYTIPTKNEWEKINMKDLKEE